MLAHLRSRVLLRRRYTLAIGTTLATALGLSVAVGTTAQAGQAQPRTHVAGTTSGIQLIKHVIVIMEENRSFDSYFGKYPGATGIPAGVCVASWDNLTNKGVIRSDPDAVFVWNEAQRRAAAGSLAVHCSPVCNQRAGKQFSIGALLGIGR